MISRNFIPSLFTILNAFCGFLSIINSANGNYDAACMFIFYAMLFDAFDGIVARALNSSSEFGVELDSLSDVISFGVAPSVLLYYIQFSSLETFGVIISSLMLVFAAIRLARFNVQLTGFDKKMFKGLSAPVSAATLCAYILFYHNRRFDVSTSELVLYALAIGLPLLMVSRLTYDTLPKLSKSGFKQNPAKFVILFISIALILITKGEAIFFICLFYVLTGIIRSIANLFRSGNKHSPEKGNDVVGINGE